MMDDIYSLPPKEINFNLCGICQKRKANESLSELLENGKKRLLEAAIERKSFKDESNAESVVRIIHILDNANENKIFKYHRKCYATFTNKTVIGRLEKKPVEIETDVNLCDRVTRASLGSTDWEKCVACQEDKDKEKVRQVMSFNMSETIKSYTAYDLKLQTRLSAIPDLIAKKVKYHSTCLLKLERIKKTSERNLNEATASFSTLCKELRVAGALGKILKLSDVWTRFESLTKSFEEPIPASFLSRLSSFKEKLEIEIGDIFFFFQPLDRSITERGIILIPLEEAKKTTAEFSKNEFQDVLSAHSTYGKEFTNIVTAATIIRNDLKNHQGLSGLSLSDTDIESVIPDSLALFLKVLFGDKKSLDDIFDADDEESEEMDANTEDEGISIINKKTNEENSVLSIAQDIVYGVSKTRKLTPKHIGLAVALHQCTRSKKLVTLFHKAGHCVSYEKVLKIDTTLAKLSLNTLNPVTGAVTPPNFKTGHDFQNGEKPILHVTADNVDIMTDTLDGKVTFHGTQMVAFQRGARSTDDILRMTRIGKEKKLIVPAVLSELQPFMQPNEKVEPSFTNFLNPDTYNATNIDGLLETSSKTESRMNDIAFALTRKKDENRISWTEFQKSNSTQNNEKSVIGYMPIINNPAHELSTLIKVLDRCLSIADDLHMQYVILTTDQALYSKLLELRWNSNVFKSRVILRMGGLHISLNFMKVTGKHMKGTGIEELWLESGVLAQGSIQKVMEGKAYAKGMRIHKLTFQAIWRIVGPQFESYLKSEDSKLSEDFENLSEDFSKLYFFLKTKEVADHLNNFIERKCENSANFKLWWSYVDMVLTQLMLTKSIRGGNWDMYLTALTEMLPYVARYDHSNYFRSMSVYITDMNQLPKEVEDRFRAGDFGVLLSDQKFAQVDPDHAQEWVVGICKSSGGLIGITQNEAALQKWALSYHWRADLTTKTFALYGIHSNLHCKEEGKAQKLRDKKDEDLIFEQMKAFDLFGSDVGVCNIANKDQATTEISEALLNAKHKGQLQVQEFVSQRLIRPQFISFHAPIPKNKALTFPDLYKVKSVKDPQKILQADRSILQRLLVAFEAGRTIELKHILKHELLPVPLSLAEMDGSLRSTDKSILIKLLTEKIECPTVLPLEKVSSALIIDGQAYIMALGKPPNLKTFKDLAEYFIGKVKNLSLNYKRVDIVFDRYRDKSIKAGTRKKRANQFNPIRRIIQNENVPLPNDWKNYILCKENKEELAAFLSKIIMETNFQDCDVVVSGGFNDERLVKCTNKSTDVSMLSATHEEADTRVVLHAVNIDYRNIVIMARDTDICILLIKHYPKMNTAKVWMMSGTAKERKFIPIHDISKNLTASQINNIHSFHALTGCDSTSQFAGITKKTAWKVFMQERFCALLDNFGDQPLQEKAMEQAEEFVTKMYKVNCKTVDEARHLIFGKVKKPEHLPPTSDALRFHMKRCHYQACVWQNSHLSDPALPRIEDCGWELVNGGYIPKLKSLEPVPESCTELLKCGCKTPCANRMCRCRKSGLKCTRMCLCQGMCLNSENAEAD